MSARISDSCKFLLASSSELPMLPQKKSNILKIFGCWYTKVVSSFTMLDDLACDAGLSLISDLSEVKKHFFCQYSDFLAFFAFAISEKR